MSRVFLLIAIVVLAVVMVAVAGLGVAEFTRPIPGSCGDYGGGESLAPAACHKNVALYVFGLVVLGGAVAALWRRLGR